MKVLVKAACGNKSPHTASFVVLKDHRKRREVMKLISVRDYASAVRYIRGLVGGDKDTGEEPFSGTKKADLVLTPSSARWDLVGND
ncbi:MAG TPA: hypothetical protein PKZ41_00175 [Candidatus Omnitrophota bacterium]|nr:hypothetical protein [Candidatus Omnitrophota bacterium]